MLPNKKSIKLTKNCQKNGTLKNTPKTEKRLKQSSMTSAKPTMFSLTAILELIMMKWLVGITLMMMQNELSNDFSNSMELLMKLKESSFNSIILTEREILMKFSEFLEMPPSKTLMLLTESLLCNITQKITKTLMPERNSMKSMKLTITLGMTKEDETTIQ